MKIGYGVLSLGAFMLAAGIAQADKPAAAGPSQAELQELTTWCNKLGSWRNAAVLLHAYDAIVYNGLCTPQSYPASITAGGKETTFWIDRPGFASPVTKTIYMGWCLNADPKYPSGANYAACLPDADAFDDAGKAALVKELDEKKFPALAKTRMQAYFDAVKKRLGESKVQWTAAVAKGGLCEEVQKTAPAKALADVRAQMQAGAKALELAMSIRDQVLADGDNIYSRKVKVDCEPLRTATREYLASTKPEKLRDALWKFREDVVGYNMMSTLTLCDAATGNIHMASFENKIVHRPGAPASGERWALRQAVLSAYRPKMSEYMCNSENFPQRQLEEQANYANPFLKFVDTWSRTHNEPNMIEVGDGDSRDARYGMGTVAAIKKTPAGPELSFKAETRWEYTQTCKNTTFWGWDSSGHPFWNQDCKFDKGTSYKVKFDPMVFDPLSLVGVKVGDTIKFASTSTSGAPYTKTGLVTEIVKQPKGGVGATTTLAFYGVPLAVKAEASVAAKGKGKAKGK